MDNTALARFITSLGSLNNYGSTILQTKKALDEQSTKPLRQNIDDIAIFKDSLKGIEAIKKRGFNTEGIIAVNKQFDTPSDEQPTIPGHLRNAYYNEDDRISVVIDRDGRESYIPKDVITKSDIEAIVCEFELSNKTEKDAWRVFAQLSKLQAFQDGNKRTALIACNSAYGSLDSGNYLTLPFNNLDRVEFTINLMRYYSANSPEGEFDFFNRMMDLLPNEKDRINYLNQPIEEQDIASESKTRRIKSQLRNYDLER